jgi:hypothetical protein
MSALLEHPAVQAAFAPFVVALVVAIALSRTRLAWTAVLAAYVTTTLLGAGFSFEPLTAGRKVALLVLLAPVVGLALDALARRRPALPSAVAVAVALAAGAATVWVFVTVLSQRDALPATASGAGLALFVAALAWLVLRLREDGIAAGAAGLGLGLATGIGALLSASTGYFAAGTSFAAGAGALLLLQVLSGRSIAPGLLGTATIGVGVALFAAASNTIAQLPWYALPLLLLVPLVAGSRLGAQRPTLTRAAILAAASVAAAAVPIAAAWLATLAPAG